MKLIIMTGAPASGKSSVADEVGKKLGIDVISKDGYKIELFEKYGFTNHAEKKKLSIRGEEILHETIKKYVDEDKDIIVDNNFKNFNIVREILENAKNTVDVRCVYYFADYEILANRYNERINKGKRHTALYTLNQYPVIEGVSEFHPIITKDDVDRIEKGIQEYTFGEDVLEVNTDHIDVDFDLICNVVIEYINNGSNLYGRL